MRQKQSSKFIRSARKHAVGPRRSIRVLVVAVAAWCGALSACRPKAHGLDAGQPARPMTHLDSGQVTLSDAQLIQWAAGVTGSLSADSRDPLTFETKAAAEVKWRARSGLTDQEIDDIELLVSTIVTQQRIAKLTGADAVRSFEQSSQALKSKRDAGAAFESQRLAFEFQIRAQQSSALKMLEIQFGTEAVQAVLRNEAALTRAWETAVEATHSAPTP